MLIEGFMENKNIKSREKKSNLYDQVAIAVLNFSDEQAENFIKSLNAEKSTFSNYKRLFISMRNGLNYQECISSLNNNKLNLRQWLENLKERLINFAEDKGRSHILKQIIRAEAAFKIGLEVQGTQIIEEIEKQLLPKDFWLTWRIYELKFVYYDLIKRHDINTPDSLYYIVSSIMKSGTKPESDYYELSRHSDFVSFLEKTRSKSFEEIEIFKSLQLQIENLYQNVYSDNLNKNSESFNSFYPDINQLELFKLVDETIKCIFFAIQNRLYDTHGVLINGSVQMIEKLKQILTESDFSGPMGWPNLLSVYLVQKQAELNLCMSFLNEKRQSENELERVFTELNAISNITYRIQILDIIGRVFALQFGYGPIDKFELAIHEIHEDITNLLNTKNKLDLPIYVQNCLKTLKVLLADTSGLNNLKTAGPYGSLKRELLTIEKFKDYVSLDQKDLDFDSCSNFIEYAIIKLYKIAWQRKNAKKEFINKSGKS
jgi:hypothetical protein